MKKKKKSFDVAAQSTALRLTCKSNENQFQSITTNNTNAMLLM